MTLPLQITLRTKKNTKKIFLSPTTTEENEDVIKTFNLNKAIGPDSIAVNAKQI